MGLLEADPGPEYRVKAGRNKISPESNIESKPVELAPVQNWQEGNHGPEAPKRAFEKEKSRRRCAKIAIMISTIVIVLIVVLTPVSVYLAKNEKSKGTAPTKSSGTARPSTAPTTTSPKATNASTRTVIVNTTVIRTTARPTLRTTTVSRTCTPFLPTSNHSSHHWRCSDENNVASTCVLTCNQVGFVSLKPESKCLSSGLWSRQWSECIASNPCDLSTHNCSVLASCKSTQPGKYRCTCNAGFAGDGINCGNDTDADGIPDKALPCTSKSCTMDNCVSLPNSGQEDFDGDGKGDACDDDDDNDGISDSHDNCPLVSNADQTDREPDGVGDACDNCPSVNNTDQVDTNKNGIGDACESDVDSDGVLNESDNCVLVYNPDQKDNDTDGVGDVCDNCRDVANADQKDEDDNLVGDACQDGPDSDSDGIKDKYDNCKDTANGDQTDTDRDDVGDACDADKDGDGIGNLDDNCPLVANRDQVDGNKNGIGDACEDDDDGDGVDNDKDDFPLNASKNQTDFRVSDMVIFDGKGTAQDPPKWFQFDQGREILQTINGNPGALLSKTFFGDLIFTGTLMIRSPPFGVTPDDDYVGIIFGFQSNRKFYVCSWKRGSQSYNLKNAGPYPRAYGRKGISLKSKTMFPRTLWLGTMGRHQTPYLAAQRHRVEEPDNWKFHSSTGPGIAMRDALWETGNAINQSTLLWHDKSPVWSFNVSYQWKLVHNPDSGRMRISWYQGKNMISDSGNIVDKSLRGGRVGVFVFSQENVYFSAMRTKNTKINDYAIEFDGQNSYIDIGSQSDLLSGEKSFTVELWTRIEGVSNTSCMPPRNIDFGTIDHSDTHFFAQDANDERDWQFPNVIIPSKTSPEFDHTSNNGTGRFAYFSGRWTGSGPYLGDRARLLSPWFPANDSCALDFFLHMWDADATVAKTQMGSLQIEVRDTDKIWKQRFWIKGNQNNTWHQRKVLLQILKEARKKWGLFERVDLFQKLEVMPGMIFTNLPNPLLSLRKPFLASQEAW
eukprot:gene7442-13206_t